MSKFALLCLFPCLSLLPAIVHANGQEPQAQVIQSIAPKEAFALIQENKANPDFIIVDVRTSEEFAEEHLENAINLDYYSDTFRSGLDKLDRAKVYLIYCRSGRRSESALAILQELGFKTVYNMLGGMVWWKEEGLPSIRQG